MLKIKVGYKLFLCKCIKRELVESVLVVPIVPSLPGTEHCGVIGLSVTMNATY